MLFVALKREMLIIQSLDLVGISEGKTDLFWNGFGDIYVCVCVFENMIIRGIMISLSDLRYFDKKSYNIPYALQGFFIPKSL